MVTQTMGRPVCFIPLMFYMYVGPGTLPPSQGALAALGWGHLDLPCLFVLFSCFSVLSGMPLGKTPAG